MIDVWFDFNVGNIHTDEDGSRHYHVKSRGEYQLTVDMGFISLESVRQELHKQLDRAVNLHLKESVA
jgi:hypothetical protein